VRLVYVDEAGISNPAEEPFLVVSGVIVHADRQLVAVERYLERLIERHIPESQRAGFIFHAKEIFNGGGKVFDRDEWPLQKRLAIAGDLAAIFRRFRLPVALGFVERATLHRDFVLPDKMSARDKALFAHVSAFITCSMFVEKWMRQEAPAEVCMMIVEDNQQARSLIRFAQNYHQGPEPLKKGESKEFFPFKKIKEDPLFQEKRPVSLLQLADFAAYVFKKHLMKNGHYSRFLGPMSDQVIVFPSQESPVGRISKA
jgi:hypothetical protein